MSIVASASNGFLASFAKSASRIVNASGDKFAAASATLSDLRYCLCAALAALSFCISWLTCLTNVEDIPASLVIQSVTRRADFSVIAGILLDLSSK